MKQILIKNSIFFDQIAILEDGKLQDFMYEEKNSESLLGNIYLGRVENVLPGMDAAFVNVGLKKNAYMHITDLLSDKFIKDKKIRKRDIKCINQVLKKGEEIPVQIIREPIGEKYISVTADISFPGKYIALTPNSIEINISNKIRNKKERERLEQIGKNIMSDGNGLIFRTFSENKPEIEIHKEYKMLCSLFNQIKKELNYSYAPKLLFKSNSLIEKVFLDHIDSSIDEIYVENKQIKTKLSELIENYNDTELSNLKIIELNNAFETFNIEKKIDMLFERKVELDNGGSIFIDVTEALTVIDVNSGKYIGNENMEDTALKLNLYALDEIGRQIKLRNISGIIIIDFIEIKKHDNINLIIDKAKKVFNKDRAKTNIIGMTKLNLMEVTRKKEKENFFNTMSVECESCKGSGRLNSRVLTLIKIENTIRKIKNNTSCESVVLKIGSLMYNKINISCMDYINNIENRYGIKIYFKEDKNILNEDIVIEKMGKLEYINCQK